MPATATSWKREPFKEGVSLPYKASFDSRQFSALKQGLIPQRMENKWFIYYEEPHLFLHRSWTGEPVYRLNLNSVPGRGAEVIEALWSRHLADAHALTQGPEYQVRLLDFLLSNFLFGLSKPFPMPADIEETKQRVFQHAVAGGGYPQPSPNPQSSPTPKKPWWVIW